MYMITFREVAKLTFLDKWLILGSKEKLDFLPINTLFLQ